MKKVLIFPGAFNPPHYGHVFALQKALEDSHFDEVWIIPSGKREDKDISISYEDRRALNKLFVDYLNKNLKVLCKLRTDELDNIEGKYTSEILEKIKSEPNIKFTQLIGTDGYMFLRNQIPPDEFKKERFIVVSRNGYKLSSNTELDRNNIFVYVDSKEISSTQIRSMSNNNDSEYQKLTLPDIAFYIKEHKLYS
jgi:nicotinate-nucleotide adenylyltransferase